VCLTINWKKFSNWTRNCYVHKRVCYPIGHVESTNKEGKNVLFMWETKKERKREIAYATLIYCVRILACAAVCMHLGREKKERKCVCVNCRWGSSGDDGSVLHAFGKREKKEEKKIVHSFLLNKRRVLTCPFHSYFCGLAPSSWKKNTISKINLQFTSL
jgi:hypothetical protein